MKKLLTIFIFIFLLVGCGKKQTTNDNGKNLTIDYIKYSFEKVIENSEFIYTGKLKESKKGKNILGNSNQMDYTTRGDYTIYTFTITNTLYKSYDINKAEINIYTERNNTYQMNDEYLLPVSLTNNAYFIDDIFTIKGSIVLSFDNPSNNRINITDKITTKNNMNLSETFDKDELISYVNGLNKGKLAYYYGETNHQKIIENSPFIFKIKIGDLAFTRDSDYAKCEAYKIEILEEIKGEKYNTTGDIKIQFKADSVKKNDIIYVGLDVLGYMAIDDGFFYNLTSNTFLNESDFN